MRKGIYRGAIVRCRGEYLAQVSCSDFFFDVAFPSEEILFKMRGVMLL